MSKKLTICFNPWMIFNQNDDYDSEIEEIAKRGFNCIRLEDGAGLLWDQKGNVRTDILISSPFGKFTKYTSYRPIVNSQRVNLLDRLLRICMAAKKHNVKLILSSWFFLHTNWFCEEEVIQPLFDLSTNKKISFFADELARILDVLKKENLIDVVAFAEIFNEFDGLPFAGEYRPVPSDKANELRVLHEAEIDKLKNKHPDILFAFDTWTPNVNSSIIPRNIDVLNVHIYYAWSVYQAFENGVVKRTFDEPVFPEETKYFLKEKTVSVKEILEEMGEIKTGFDWPRRICLYASLDEAKLDELACLLDAKLQENIESYRSKFRESVEHIIETHDKVVPHSKIVIGEGLTYCASPLLTFERDSQAFWQLVKEQMKCFNENGFFGAVIATTHAKNRSAAWQPCKELYLEANKIFLDEK